MATTPRDRLDREIEKLGDCHGEAGMTDACHDALAEFADAMDPDTVRHQITDDDGQTKTYALRTTAGYVQSLRICTQEGLDLTDCTIEAFNDCIIEMHDGPADKTKVTLMRYQAAAELFYRYHDDLGVDPEDIDYFKERSAPKHDETDLFAESEVEALRRACGQTELPTRNRALLELLIFTGQRIGALVTLRVKDVDTHEGYLHLNDDYDARYGGLKGALARGRRRPMFGAAKYVRDWLQYHPEGDDAEAWLFIGNPSHWKTDPDGHWAKVSASHVLRRIGEYAEVDKPVNPHNFRHYCATVLYRDYDLDSDTIRMLLGHVEGSTAFEDTYSHVVDGDYIDKAEEALGYKESEPTETFTPDMCPTCGELLQDDWRSCPNCNEQFGPTGDIEAAAEDIREDATADLTDPDTDLSDEQRAAIGAIFETVENPDALARALLEQSG